MSEVYNKDFVVKLFQVTDQSESKSWAAVDAEVVAFEKESGLVATSIERLEKTFDDACRNQETWSVTFSRVAS